MRKLVLISIMLAACGSGKKSDSAPVNTAVASDPSGDTTNPAMSMAVATQADLPECLAANNRQLVYAMDTKAFYTCQDLKWEKIDIGVGALDSATLYARLRTIKLGDTFAGMASEAREVLLGGGFEVKTVPWQTCGDLEQKEYGSTQAFQDEHKLGVSITLYEDKVVGIYINKEGVGPETQYADCP